MLQIPFVLVFYLVFLKYVNINIFHFLNSQMIIVWELETTQEPVGMQCDSQIKPKMAYFLPRTETEIRKSYSSIPTILVIFQKFLIILDGGSQNAWQEIWTESTILWAKQDSCKFLVRGTESFGIHLKMTIDHLKLSLCQFLRWMSKLRPSKWFLSTYVQCTLGCVTFV